MSWQKIAFQIPKKKFSPTKVRTVAFVLIFTSLIQVCCGCQLPYITRSAYSHLKIMRDRTPINKILERKDLPENQRHKLELAIKIRPYIQGLGLNVTKNYTTYVDIGRPYISYLLTVAPAFSLEPMTWSFPFVGTFPYKGFHDLQEASTQAQKYANKNYDTYVRGVTAYSTLGWFKDPLLSSMLEYSDAQWIETIIHESVHATIFVKNNVAFNENLAVFIAREATKEFYRKYDPENFEPLMQTYADEKVFSDFLQQSLTKLEHFYNNSDPNHLTTTNKEQEIQRIKQVFKTEVQPALKVLKFENFLKASLNNAYFASQKVYFDRQDLFSKKYQDFSSLEDFIEYLKKEEKHLIHLFK